MVYNKLVSSFATRFGPLRHQQVFELSTCTCLLLLFLYSNFQILARVRILAEHKCLITS
jgi:hypothetical protein